MKQVIYTKQCKIIREKPRQVEEFEEKDGHKFLTRRELIIEQEPCGSFMPDEYDICDWCLEDKYREELGMSTYDRCNDPWRSEPLYYKENVLKAIRKAEQK